VALYQVSYLYLYLLPLHTYCTMCTFYRLLSWTRIEGSPCVHCKLRQETEASMSCSGHHVESTVFRISISQSGYCSQPMPRNVASSADFTEAACSDTTVGLVAKQGRGNQHSTRPIKYAPFLCTTHINIPVELGSRFHTHLYSHCHTVGMCNGPYCEHVDSDRQKPLKCGHGEEWKR